MKAMVITNFGGTDVFKLQDLPVPQPAANEVLVRVHAVSVNPVDYKIRQAGSWAGIQPPTVIGYDVSGVVEAVGDVVKDFKVGDEVFYTSEIFGRQGSYAEYHVENEAIVAKKPSNLSFIEAASIPLAGGTAWDTLITRAQIKPGESVLIHGGTGGVGSLAVQIAKTAGAYVYTTCSKRHTDLAKQLGADRVIDYTSEDFTEIINKETRGAGIDAVFDTVGGDIIARSISITRLHGRIVGIVDTTGNLNAAFLKNITLHFLFLERARYKLDALRNLIERGQIKPVVASVMPLNEVAKAHQQLEGGGVGGKIVLKVD
jgi:NADPH:quinone reductase